MILWTRNLVKNNHLLFIQPVAILANDSWVRIGPILTIWFGTQLTGPTSSPVLPQTSKPRHMGKFGIPGLILRVFTCQLIPLLPFFSLTAQIPLHNYRRPILIFNVNNWLIFFSVYLLFLCFTMFPYHLPVFSLFLFFILAFTFSNVSFFLLQCLFIIILLISFFPVLHRNFEAWWFNFYHHIEQNVSIVDWWNNSSWVLAKIGTNRHTRLEQIYLTRGYQTATRFL